MGELQMHTAFSW